MISLVALFTISNPPLLSREGKLLTEMVGPNKDSAVVALLLHRTTRLSGNKIYLGIGPLCTEPFPIRYPFKLIVWLLVFFNSIHSKLGKPTIGDGSIISSSITRSNGRVVVSVK